MLSVAQQIAKVIGIKDKDERNTYFSSNIHHPNNQSIRLKRDSMISLGDVRKEHLLDIIKETIRHFIERIF